MSAGSTIKAILAVLIPGGFIVGGIYAGVNVRLLTKICFSIAGFKIKSLDSNYIYLDILLNVKNPSRLDVKVGGYDINATLNGTPVGKIVDKTEKVLLAEQITPLLVPIQIDHNKAFGQIKSKEILGYFLTNNWEKIIVSLDIKFKGEVLRIPISTSVNLSYSLKEIKTMMAESKNTPPCISKKEQNQLKKA
ncbi:MAG TPA: hypothetical protein PK289_00050 [Bacteroidia bacterium]|nr:hypothetical protein [Bacteroidia bacterium]